MGLVNNGEGGDDGVGSIGMISIEMIPIGMNSIRLISVGVN